MSSATDDAARGAHAMNEHAHRGHEPAGLMGRKRHWQIIAALYRGGVRAGNPLLTDAARVLGAIVDAQGRMGLDGRAAETMESVERALGVSMGLHEFLCELAAGVEAVDARRAENLRHAARMVLESARAVARLAGVGEA